MSKKFVLLFPVLMLSSMVTPIATVTRVDYSVSGIELKYRTSLPPQQGLVYVLVETSVFDRIENSLDRYANDLESIEGFSVGIYTVSTSNTTAVRLLLQQALPEGLVGCLLVGDIPAAYYQYGDFSIVPPINITFATDFYYMDLDGTWTDSDNDGIFDGHSGNVEPEIWVGRLKPSILGNEIANLQNYFNKNHNYKTGSLSLPDLSLSYIDDDWIPWADSWNNSVGLVYSNGTLVKDGSTTISEEA